MFKKYIKKTISSAQHCQRNWDLSKEISEEDLDVLAHAIKQSPTKQNRVFYRAVIITDRDVIEALHKETDGFVYDFENNKSVTNSQVLANSVVALIRDGDDTVRTVAEYEGNGRKKTDEDRAIGVVAGILTVTAEMLGLKSGCCQCMSKKVNDILDGEVLLLMGIGHGDASRNRLEHHENPDFKFPSLSKNTSVTFL